MSEFHFLRPLWLLALVPTVLIWCLAWRKTGTAGALAKVVDPHLLKHLLVDAESLRGFRAIHLLGLVWLISLLALAGPSWKQEPSPLPTTSRTL